MHGSGPPGCTPLVGLCTKVHCHKRSQILLSFFMVFFFGSVSIPVEANNKQPLLFPPPVYSLLSSKQRGISRAFFYGFFGSVSIPSLLLLSQTLIITSTLFLLCFFSNLANFAFFFSFFYAVLCVTQFTHPTAFRNTTPTSVGSVWKRQPHSIVCRYSIWDLSFQWMAVPVFSLSPFREMVIKGGSMVREEKKRVWLPIFM